MNMQFGIPYITIKTKLSKIKALLSKQQAEKRKRLIKKTSRYKKEIVNQLYGGGYSHIQMYSLSTWKYYGEDHVRLTFRAIKDKRIYIIKVTKGFEEKIRNSINFQNQFNDIFGFIPKGFEVGLDGYIGYATEYIPSYPFSWIKYLINESNIDDYLYQINAILDELNQYHIVHCDLEAVNILIGKKDRKIYLIDWDTSCSDLVGLHCDHFPGYTIKRKVDKNQFIYDDAYSFYTLLQRLNCNYLDSRSGFMSIRQKIDRNIHLASE